jgi:putative permease
MRNLFGEIPVRILAFAGLLVLVVLAFLAVEILIVPFVAALFVIYLFEPAVTAMQIRGMDPGKAFLILLVITFMAVTAALMFMPSWLRMESIAGSGETLSQRIEHQLDETEGWVHGRFPMFQSVKISEQLSTRAAGFAGHFFEEMPELLTSFAINLLLVPFIAYFMVRDGKMLKRHMVQIVPNRYFEMAMIMMYRIDRQIGGYLRGRLIECILVGVAQMLFMGIVAMFVPQPQILLISAVAGITNIIPYLGPVIGLAFGALLYVGAGLPMSAVYGLMLAVALAHVLDNIVIAPAVLSHNVDLHPLSVALVLVIGGELMGALGLLIAIPVASSIKVIAQEFYTNYRLQVRST